MNLVREREKKTYIKLGNIKIENENNKKKSIYLYLENLI